MSKQPPQRTMGADLRSYAYHGDLGLARHLLVEGADPNVLDEHGRSALTLAAMQGHEDMVDLLISHGAWVDPHKDYDTYQTPLSGAAQNGHLGIVKRLVTAGANYHFHSWVSQRTAENYARANGHDEVAAFLANLPPKK